MYCFELNICVVIIVPTRFPRLIGARKMNPTVGRTGEKTSVQFKQPRLECVLKNIWIKFEEQDITCHSKELPLILATSTSPALHN